MTAIMTQEWSKELELSSEILQISPSHSTLPCIMHGRHINAFYNPLVGANIISSACVLEFLGDEPLVPTDIITALSPCGESMDEIENSQSDTHHLQLCSVYPRLSCF
jgi:hypothetical protein